MRRRVEQTVAPQRLGPAPRLHPSEARSRLIQRNIHRAATGKHRADRAATGIHRAVSCIHRADRATIGLHRAVTLLLFLFIYIYIYIHTYIIQSAMGDLSSKFRLNNADILF